MTITTTLSSIAIAVAALSLIGVVGMFNELEELKDHEHDTFSESQINVIIAGDVAAKQVAVAEAGRNAGDWDTVMISYLMDLIQELEDKLIPSTTFD